MPKNFILHFTLFWLLWRPPVFSQQNCLINSTFDHGSDGFQYTDSQNHPEYATGQWSTSNQSLMLQLGGVDRLFYNDGNENSWQITFTGGGEVTIQGDFNLFVARAFESDEYGEVRLRLDGQLYGLSGKSYLARLTGSDLDQSKDHVSGWTSFEIIIPAVPEGQHILSLAAFNNKKTRPNEIVQVYFDNIQVCTTSSITPSDTLAPEIVLSPPLCGQEVSGEVSFSAEVTDDGGVSGVAFLVDGDTLVEKSTPPYTFLWDTRLLGDGMHTVVIQAEDVSGNAGELVCEVMVKNTPDPASSDSSCVVVADFGRGVEGFEFVSSPTHGEYSWGSWSSSGRTGGALEVRLGGVDNVTYTDGNEAGWRVVFSGSGRLWVEGWYRLVVSRYFESDEYGEVRLRLDGNLVSVDGESYVAHVVGEDGMQSSDHDTGWQSFSVVVEGVAAGSHDLQFLAYNNKKTRANEEVEVYFDDLLICVGGQVTAPDTTPPEVVIMEPTGSGRYSTSSGVVRVGGKALDDVGVARVLWRNEATGGSGEATGTEVWEVGAIPLQGGSNRIVVEAYDGGGNVGRDTLVVEYTEDITPPLITEITISEILPTRVTVSWKTSEPADSRVEYGLTLSSKQEIRIMPLGNSITYGKKSNPDGGYRDDLYFKLIDAGYRVNFVGSLHTGSGFDADHEGHPGYFAETIDASISEWLDANPPDVVLFHIGTNDITAVFPFDKTIRNITSTLNQIWAFDSTIWVVLSKITPRSDLDFYDQQTTTLNDLIGDFIQSLQNDGKPILLADHNAAFKKDPDWAVSLLSDGKHPSNDGYAVMADVYFQSLEQILGKGTSSKSDTALVTAHTITLTGLTPNRNYIYRVISTDAAGNQSISQQFTFMTPNDGNINASFDNSTDGFEYVDSANHPEYARGSVSSVGNPGGSLELILGGVDNQSYSDGVKNGWRITFVGGGTITIQGEYYLFISRTFEGDEYGEARLRFDGQLYGVEGNKYLGHLDGSDTDQTQDHETGWVPFTITLSNQTFGTHKLELMAYNNKKTRANEQVIVRFDNIVVSTSGQTEAFLKSLDSFTAKTDLSGVPFKNELLGNYPNPFNPSTTIVFSLQAPIPLRVIIYNVLGQEVKRLFDGMGRRGITALQWDGTDARGLRAGSGVYFVTIHTPIWKASHRMFLMK